MVRRTRRRRTLGVAAVAAAFIAAGGGALATSLRRPPPCCSNIKGVTVTIDLEGDDLVLAKQALAKGSLKPGSVLAVDPHAPKVVKSGDTVNLVLCSR
ncbi:hypothetical protein FNH08_43650 [Streptomyces spongiae]|uniref:PASTA domain-containing protein n=2 Tax=Streptomyces spongiae TaxID=565072 RepID=A0A5N8XWQ3_9ACTN|nr:hypothetical protein [Streptomyces spongiae]